MTPANNAALQQQAIRASDVDSYLNALTVEEKSTAELTYELGPFLEWLGLKSVDFKNTRYAEPPLVLAFAITNPGENEKLVPLPNLTFDDYDGIGFPLNGYTRYAVTNSDVFVESRLHPTASRDPLELLFYVLENKAKRRQINTDV